MGNDNDEGNETLYAGSTNSSSSSSSFLPSSDGCRHTTNSCFPGCAHYEEVGGSNWVTTGRTVAERRYYGRLWGARLRSFVVVASGEFIRTRSSCTTSSLLCGVSGLLAACSLSSLAACIALTVCSLSCFKLSCDTVSTSSAEGDIERDDIRSVPQADMWTETLLRPPLADRRVSERRSKALSDLTAHYSLDCVAEAGRAKCRPVQKAQSLRGGFLSSVHHQYRHSVAAFRVLADGVYHVSAQVAGTVWQQPPTLLRVVIARVIAKSGTANVTTVHSITGAGGGGDALATAVVQRGAFSVYTAASVRLNAGEQLLAQVICVEEPNCIVHVNGTASQIMLERLN